MPLIADLEAAKKQKIIGDHELFRGVLSNSLVDLPLSAAGQQATRLAACHDGSFVFASGAKVYRVNCSPTRKRTRPETSQDEGLDIPTGTESRNTAVSAVSSAMADDFMVPRPFSWLDAQISPIHSTHRAEIQSVAADDTRIASVDAYGRCIVTSGKFESVGSNEQAEEKSKTDTNSVTFSPISFRHGSRGWAGVALRRNDPKSTAVARQFFRDITLFDADVPVRTIYTILPPLGISFCQQMGSVAVAEGSDLTFYDYRASENRGCVSRKTLGNGSLLSIDVSDDSAIVATAGMDRTLNIFDTRMMNTRERWSGCLKYECGGVVLSREMEGMAYVCSVDNELACGAWSTEMATYLKIQDGSKSLMISGANTKSPRRAFGFRADVRLIGMARRTNVGEEVAVMSESGAFYLLRRKPE